VLNRKELRDFLEEKYDLYNRVGFIKSDPVCIPHLFEKKEDIEIAGFLAATIAWGQRATIISNATQLMQLMENSPHRFVLDFDPERDTEVLGSFVHRTFNSTDLLYFLRSLQHIYTYHGGLEAVFSANIQGGVFDAEKAIVHFRNVFFELEHPERTGKHVSNPGSGSSAKRIAMYLRWMVRKDNRGVDFGLWKSIPAAGLVLPLDVHSGRVARRLGLLKRTQDDWKAVCELTDTLRTFDPVDPVKYDFALFGLGVNEKF
jgi:uncharacterized protein (TIGR02757 family)